MFDSQPRTFSNLFVDRTANNPAAVATTANAGSSTVTRTSFDGYFGTVDDQDVFFTFEREAGRWSDRAIQRLVYVLTPISVDGQELLDIAARGILVATMPAAGPRRASTHKDTPQPSAPQGNGASASG